MDIKTEDKGKLEPLLQRSCPKNQQQNQENGGGGSDQKPFVQNQQTRQNSQPQQNRNSGGINIRPLKANFAGNRTHTSVNVSRNNRDGNQRNNEVKTKWRLDYFFYCYKKILDLLPYFVTRKQI